MYAGVMPIEKRRKRYFQADTLGEGHMSIMYLIPCLHESDSKMVSS